MKTILSIAFFASAFFASLSAWAAFAPPPAQGTAVACASSNQCNDLASGIRPPCASVRCNVCKDGNCVWQVDASISQCKCVPGTIRWCNATQLSTCNANGTGWGTCK